MLRHPMRFICAAFLVAAALTGLVRVQPAYAATRTVTNLNDSGAGSLRQKIADAAPGDTIVFDAALSDGSIPLASTLTLAKNVTIDASALDEPITLSGDTNSDGFGDVRVLYVSSGVTVKLVGLSIQYGRATEGGGIQNLGTLTIESSQIALNMATSFGGGGINNSGTLVILESAFSYNSAVTSGGAVSNYGSGSMTVYSSSFSQNSAREGGGIGNSRPLTVVNSTFYNNAATMYGGGAINNSNTLTISNSTFSLNTAATSGGGISNYGGGTLHYANTIIANSSGGDCFNNSTIGAHGNNLVEDGSCSANLSGDPNLGALQWNGGPTRTMALLSGSPAIDAGDDAICASAPVDGLDQRGASRPQGAHCDIGAYERAASLVVTNTSNGGTGSLRSTLQAAASGEAVTFDAALSGATIRLGYPITIDKDITIDGAALAVSIRLSGDSDNNGVGDVRLFAIEPGRSVTWSSLTLILGSGDYGGAVSNRGNLTIRNSTFSQNGATASGGAIYNYGTLNVVNSTLAGNSAGSGGGGILNAGALNVLNSTLSANSAVSGGGIYNGFGGTFTYGNIIIADSGSGGDCVNYGTLDFPTGGLIEDGSCSAYLSGDPMLGVLAYENGNTMTMALLPGSPAIDAGNALICANASVNNLDQRGVTRPQDGDNDGNAVCDIGAFEYIPQPTPTRTATFAATFTPTATSTATFTPTPTGTATFAATLTPTSTTISCTAKPAKPQLVVPQNGKTVKKPKVFLDWNGESCADSYKVLVRLGSKKGNKVVNQQNWRVTEFTTKALQRGQTYYWRVSACSNTFGCSNSAWQNFKIKP